MNQPVENGSSGYGDSAEAERSAPAEARRVRRSRRTGRIAFRFVLLPVLLVFALLIGAGLYLQGRELRYDFLDRQVQDTLQQLIGDQYRIEIGETGIALTTFSALSVRGGNISISVADSGTSIAEVASVKVGISPFSILQGAPRFDRVLVEGGTLTLETLRDPSASPNVKDLDRAFAALGAVLRQSETAFSTGAITEVMIKDLAVSGAGLRLRPKTPLRIAEARLSSGEGGRLVVAASIGTGLTTVEVNGEWRPTPSAGYQLAMGIGPLDTREWTQSIDTGTEPVRGLGLNTVFRADVRIPFDGSGKPEQAYVKLQADPGKLRIGRKGITELEAAIINARVYPAENRIELERSTIVAGGVQFSVVGGLVPQEREQGFDGPLNIFLNVEKMIGSPLDPREEPITAEAKIEGTWYPPQKRLDFQTIEISTGEDVVLGAASIAFGERSPAVSGALSADSLSVTAMKQLWPLHISVGGREWVKLHTFGGAFSNFQARFDIGKGRMSEVVEGGALRPDELSLSADFKGVEISLPGELPPITDATGNISLAAPALRLNLRDGAMRAPGASPVRGINGSFTIEQIFDKPLRGSVDARFSGKLADVMAIANSRPILVAQKLAIDPASLSGTAEASLRMQLPLQAPDLYKNVDWQVEARLKEVASEKQIFGRRLEHANLTINADEKSAHVLGTAELDGIKTRIDLTEPILNGAQSLRKREVLAELTQKELAEMGLPVASVMRGKMDVKIEADGNEAERYHLDLTQSDLELPWINWLKGRGIPAKAAFRLKRQAKTTKLEDFTLAGDGFGATGEIEFDDKGLLSADLTKVSLVGDDEFAVTLSRDQGRYRVAVMGKAYDGRAMIDRVVHQQGFSNEKASVDVSVEANFANLVGFNGQIAENARLVYRTDDGLLSRFEMRGALDGQYASIDAVRNGDTTRFKFESDNAGGALAIVDLYRKMQGGKLTAKLTRTGNGPFVGNARIRNFVVEGEERLSSLVSAPVSSEKLRNASGKLRELDLSRVSFDELRGEITKSNNALEVSDGRIRNTQIGLTFEGMVFDAANKMSIRGTFMPLFTISRILGGIPILGDIFSNGKDSGLIGITYRLSGSAKNPRIQVNPISILAPGVFRQFFEFQQ